MKENYEEIYNRLVNDKKGENKILPNNIDNKPIFVDGIVAPNDEFIICTALDFKFVIDEHGMKEILKELETKISQNKENNNNPLSVAWIVSQCINDYFGGGFNPLKRDLMYDKNEIITLSDMKDKKVAMCAEKASVAQNCYAVMQEAGVEERFNPRLVNSALTTNRGRELHSFIILENVNKEKTSWLFDIMNPTICIYNGEERTGVAFYKISPEQLEEFKRGKSFKLESIYERAN